MKIINKYRTMFYIIYLHKHNCLFFFKDKIPDQHSASYLTPHIRYSGHTTYWVSVLVTYLEIFCILQITSQ
jgi:hypothetical protein